MPNSGRVTEIIDTAGTSAQYKTLSDQLDALDIKFIELTKSVMAFNNAAKDAKGFSDFNKNAAQAAINSEKLIQVQNQTAITAAKLAEQELKVAAALERQQGVRDKNAARQAQQNDKDISDSQKRQTQSEKETQKIITDSQKRIAQTDKEAEATAKALLKSYENVEKARRPFNQLGLDLKVATEKAQDLGVTFGKGSEQYQKQANIVKELSRQYNGINRDLGKFTDNVGNYASAAFGLIRQAAYILPGLGIAGIFNIIFEAVGNAVVRLGLFNKILTETQLRTKDFNDALASPVYEKVLENINKLRIDIGLAKQGFVDKNEVIEQYNATLGTAAGAVSTLDEVEQGLVKHGKAFIEITLLKAAAELALNAAAKATYESQQIQNQALEDFNTLTSFGAGNSSAPGAVPGADAISLERQRVSAQVVEQQRLTKIKKDEADKQQKIASDLFLKLSKVAKDNNLILDNTLQERLSNSYIEQQKIKLQATIDFNNDVLGNDKKSYGERQNALKAYIINQKQLLGLSLNQDLNDVTLTQDKKAVLLEKYNANIAKLDIEQDKRSRDLRSKANKDEIDFQNQRLDRQRKIAENKTLDPIAGYEDRLKALKDYQTASENIIKNTEKVAIDEAGNNSARIKTAKEKAANDLIDVETDVARKTLIIQKDVNERNAEFAKRRLDGEVASEKALENAYINASNNRLLIIDQSYSQQATILAQQYSDGEINVAEYNQRLLKLDQTTALERIQVQINTAKEIIAAQAAAAALGFGSASDLQKSANDLTKLQIQQADLVTKNKLEGIKAVKAASKDLANLEKDLADKSIDLIQTLVDSGFSKKLDALKEESDTVNENADREKEIIDNSLLSTQQKADKEKLLDAQTGASQKRLADQEKKTKHDQAIFDKAVSIAKVIEATGIAEVQALSYLSNPFTAPFYPAIAATIGALSAVQLATILATPIPAYKDGTDSHPGGKALVGDAGFELIKLPNGNSFLSDNKPTVMDLPKGTTVVPHLETVNMLQKIDYAGGRSMDMREANALLRENNLYQKKIANKSNSSINPNYKGLAMEIVNAQKLSNRRTAYFK